MTGNAGFRRLFAMQAPADLADWLDMVAIGTLLAFVWEAPPVAYAWLGFAMAAPPLTLGLLAVPSWPALVAVVALRAAVDSFFGPAKQAALPALVPGERLVAANGLSQAVNQATKVIAPALGALLLLALSPREVFVANAALSGLAALLALALPPLAPPPGALRTPFRAEFRAGLSLVARSRELRGALLLSVAATFAIFTYDTQIPPLIAALGLPPGALGLALACAGAGGLLGSSGSWACAPCRSSWSARPASGRRSWSPRWRCRRCAGPPGRSLRSSRS